MARKKKVEEDFDKAVRAFTNHCFKLGREATIQPQFGVAYRFPDGEYTFTEEILEALLNTGRVVLVSRNDKLVNLMGSLDE